MQNGDKALPSIIFAGWGLFSEYALNSWTSPYFDRIFWSNFAYLYISEIGGENDKEKEKKRTIIKNICLVRIWTTVRKAVGLHIAS